MNERLFLRLDGDSPHGPEAALPEGAMREFPVLPALRRHVAHLAAYREEIPPGCEVLERVLPDGAVRLIFNLGDAPAGGGGLPLAAVGASTDPVLLRLQGRLEGLSLALKPGAATALLGLPAGELQGQAVPLQALWGPQAVALQERMAELPTDATRAALLQAALAQRLQHATAHPPDSVAHAVRLIAVGEGRRPLREITAALGLGERRLQQLFQVHAGLPPRAYGRLARLHACLRRLRSEPAPAWSALAVDMGFYDQSHLANEFRALCGLSPGEFMRRTVSVSSKTAR